MTSDEAHPLIGSWRVTLTADGQTWSGTFGINVTSPTGQAQGSVNGTVNASRIEVTRLNATSGAASPA